jgi:membrane protease YdiL (CAAX protease family)
VTSDAGPPDPTGPAISSSRHGLKLFSIEGRAAPGLYVLGWLASLVGLGVTLIGYLGGESGAGRVLFTVGLAVLAIGLVAAAGAQAIERKTRGHDAYTGPSPVLVFAGSIPLAYLGAVLLGAAFETFNLGASRPFAELLLVVIQGAAYVALVALLVVGSGSLSWADIGFRGSSRKAVEDVAWGIIFAAPIVFVTLIVTAVLVLLFRVAPDSPLPPTGDAPGLLLHLIAGAVVAPIAEEILFRGVATTAWVRSFGVSQGILRGALFFALAHVLLIGGSTVGEGAALAVVGFAGRLPIALVLGWVFVRRNSIYASIGLHGAFNAILLVLAELSLRAAG